MWSGQDPDVKWWHDRLLRAWAIVSVILILTGVIGLFERRFFWPRLFDLDGTRAMFASGVQLIVGAASLGLLVAFVRKNY